MATKKTSKKEDIEEALKRAGLLAIAASEVLGLPRRGVPEASLHLVPLERAISNLRAATTAYNLHMIAMARRSER